MTPPEPSPPAAPAAPASAPTPAASPNHLPERIRMLADISQNLWWSWQLDARELFHRIDRRLWEGTRHNAVQFLRQVSPERLEENAQDPISLERYDRVVRRFELLTQQNGTWFAGRYPELRNRPIAYFSAEFALHQSLPIYAGGLGVLAGDHCKEASDLGIPLVGVGFMYPQGYFHQSITSEGQQEELYEHLEWDYTPVEQVVTKDGKPCILSVSLGHRVVHVSVWCVRLGRVKIYLLDTSVKENDPKDRELSARLYGGDRETRLQQEIILGVGGVRALRALGYQPMVWHLNEGHTAFVTLERMRELVDRGESFEAALEKVRRSTIFTTHTPVAAGHDAFQIDLVDSYLAGYWPNISSYRDEFLK